MQEAEDRPERSSIDKGLQVEGRNSSNITEATLAVRSYI